MSKRIMIGDQLDFDTTDLTDPKDIINDLAKELSEETHGLIKGTLAPYNGAIESFRNFEKMGELTLGVLEHDVQDSLGGIGGETHKYEFFLHTPIYEKYKFRLFFLQYGISYYPTKVVVEQTVIDSVKQSTESDYICHCRNSKEVDKLVVGILNSKRVIEIVQELIHIYHTKKSISEAVLADEE